MRIILSVFALLLIATLARSEGIYNPTAGGWFSFTGSVGGGGGGINNGTGAAVVACTPTGLKFNVACNSQYMTIIHF